MKRREFLKKTTLAAASLPGLAFLDSLPLLAQSAVMPKEAAGKPGMLPRRKYGKTDVFLSIIGFGGIVVRDTEQKDANRFVAEAFEKGVNYYDVAPSYGDAEVKLGPALEPYRKEVFLACKTTQRDYAAAKQEFERSLERMRTDYFDLYQLHAITDVQKDVERAFAEDGVMKLLLEEKKQGRIRYLGFSAHSQEAAAEAMKRYDFDSLLFPVNFVGYLEGQFGPEIVTQARDKGMAILALKILARQRAPQDDPVRKQFPKCWYQPITDVEEAKLAMTFTLSQPVTSAIPPGDIRSFRLAMELAPQIKPITEQQVAKLKELAATLNPIFKKQA